ncbi:head-tail connector protein [Xanthomonas oryzae pv. oryzicola]|uniref:head-tail connector protein n=1 Tax=Xanthomonas oryzae TaxID=347 RepID=UPI0005CEBF5E|nr:head-tail connector protein [Xanthomonas oryzae]AJQ86092.1 hypothetical protein BE73_02375 [Xanthomonas oryzae pv. oryzicola]
MLQLITAATEEPVTLVDAKQHLVVLHDADDGLIAAYITAGREVVEQQTGYALAAASYAWTPVGAGRSPLPIEPAQVTSQDGDWPLLFTTTPGPVPAALKAAILLLVGDLYANREASIQGLSENPAVSRLLFPFRRVMP